jgi:predicted aldo/keto reductase-like oxidoreductase
MPSHNPLQSDFQKQKREYLIDYDRRVPKLRQADHCIGCGECLSHCPQGIKIPDELKRINDFVEYLKQN